MRRHRQISILGFPGVGKSSIAYHFVYKEFCRDYDPNIKTNLRHQCVIDGQEYKLTIIDNAGSDQYTINHIDFENSDAYILVYAIDDAQSFQMLSKIRDKIISTSTLDRIPMVLVGNKVDRNEERVVSEEDGQSLAKSWDVPFVETSAMDFRAVQEIFVKSIKAMNSIDSSENITNEKNLSNTNQSNSKPIANGHVTNKAQSNNQKCSIN